MLKSEITWLDCWHIFNFANQYRGKYSDSLPKAVCPFHCSYSGYHVSHKPNLPSDACIISLTSFYLKLYFVDPMHYVQFWTIREIINFQDELVWGAAWLFKATRQDRYLQYLVTNGKAFGGTTVPVNAFNWDNRYAGAQILAAKVSRIACFALYTCSIVADHSLQHNLGRWVSAYNEAEPIVSVGKICT